MKTGTGTESGRAALFESMYHQHHRAVLAYCLRRTSNADAWDACAEAFTILWRRMSDAPEGEQLRPWLYGVAAKVLANQVRATRRMRRLVSRLAGQAQPTVAPPEVEVIRNAEDEEVLAAVRRLGSLDREVLLLCEWEELPRAEVAALLGLTRQTVNQRYRRALERLRRELKERGFRRMLAAFRVGEGVSNER